MIYVLKTTTFFNELPIGSIIMLYKRSDGYCDLKVLTNRNPKSVQLEEHKSWTSSFWITHSQSIEFKPLFKLIT